MKTTNRNYLLLAACIAVPMLLGFTAGMVTAQNIPGWYAGINKPWFNPPSWIFGPVWTTLYVMMGIASWRVLSTIASPDRNKAMWLYGVQLLLNFLWSFSFFYFQRPDLALLNIIVLKIAILFTIFAFARIDKVAAWLMVPYICWVSFAMILNFYIYILNP
ncbi:MAG: tryptophan-rich sensory protein [Saprospiraceae bacterium]|nr:tryptophan-rich sensory protein [Saprospiraceae bacterium]